MVPGSFWFLSLLSVLLVKMKQQCPDPVYAAKPEVLSQLPFRPVLGHFSLNSFVLSFFMLCITWPLLLWMLLTPPCLPPPAHGGGGGGFLTVHPSKPKFITTLFMKHFPVFTIINNLCLFYLCSSRIFLITFWCYCLILFRLIFTETCHGIQSASIFSTFILISSACQALEMPR